MNALARQYAATAAIGAGAVLVVGIGLWLVAKNAKNLSKATVDLAGNVAAGAVIGVGDQIGLPDTSQPSVVDEGHAAVARGDWLEASFKLPAPEFLAAVKDRLFGSTPSSAPSSADLTSGAL